MSASHGSAPAYSDYEHPLVLPQLGHLWHAPLRTISVPHSWQGGASVAATQGVAGCAGSAAATVGAAAGVDPIAGRRAANRSSHRKT